MIYIETGTADIYEIFGTEYYFAAERPLPETVFLLWQTEPTLVVGKYQNVLEEINKPYADAHGIHVVRRLSGGGTMYIDRGGWQFTFIQPRGAGEVGIEFHRYIEPVIDALREMGVEASFNGRNDLVIDGRKFSGNSQYRLGNSVVHHGTLMLNVDVEQMVAATTVDSYKITSKSIKSVRERVTNISEHLPAPMDNLTFKETLIRHIMRGGKTLDAAITVNAAGETYRCRAQGTAGGPADDPERDGCDSGKGYREYLITPGDHARILQIAIERFRGWENVYGKSPEFNIERTGRFSGGKMQFRMEVRDGMITQAAVYGDFFASVDAGTIAGALTGCRYERESVLLALRAHGLDGAVYRISAEEMAQVIAD